MLRGRFLMRKFHYPAVVEPQDNGPPISLSFGHYSNDLTISRSRSESSQIITFSGFSGFSGILASASFTAAATASEQIYPPPKTLRPLGRWASRTDTRCRHLGEIAIVRPQRTSRERRDTVSRFSGYSYFGRVPPGRLLNRSRRSPRSGTIRIRVSPNKLLIKAVLTTAPLS